MSKLKVGIVGVRLGGAYVRDYARSNRTEITAICDLDPKKQEDVSKELGLKDNQCFTDYDLFLASDIDIVVVGTPHSLPRGAGS